MSTDTAPSRKSISILAQHHFNDRLASVTLHLSDGDDDHGIYCRAVFGETTLQLEGSERSDDGAGVALLKVRACFLRLYLDGCCLDPAAELLGESGPGASVEVELQKAKKQHAKQTVKGRGTIALPTEVSAGVSAIAVAQQKTELSKAVRYKNELPRRAVEPHGNAQWIVYDRLGAALSGEFLRGTPDKLCALSPASDRYTASLNCLCYPADIEFEIDTEISFWERLKSLPVRHKRLIKIAILKEIGYHSEEPSMVELSHNKIEVRLSSD